MSKDLSANIANIIKKYYKKRYEKCQNFSKGEKEKKRQCGREQYKNLSEDEKQKLVEYRKKCEMRKDNLL